MKKNIKLPRKGFTLVELLVVMSIIAVLASISVPLVFSRLRDADKTKAIAHANQCRLAFIEFEVEEGTRPGQQIVDEGNVTGAEAGNSNAVFRQLFQRLASVRSEAIFFAPSIISRKPDDDIGDSGTNFALACEKGEVGFLYVDNPKSKQGAPLMAAPLADVSGRFDFDAYNGNAVVLKTDGAVDSLPIDEESEKVQIKVGGSNVDMLSSSNTKFREAPSILYPDPR